MSTRTAHSFTSGYDRCLCSNWLPVPQAAAGRRSCGASFDLFVWAQQQTDTADFLEIDPIESSVYTPLGPTLMCSPRPCPSGFLFLGRRQRQSAAVNSCSAALGSCCWLRSGRMARKGGTPPWSCRKVLAGTALLETAFLKPASPEMPLVLWRFCRRVLTAPSLRRRGLTGVASTLLEAHGRGPQPCWGRLPPWTFELALACGIPLACFVEALLCSSLHPAPEREADRENVPGPGFLD